MSPAVSVLKTLVLADMSSIQPFVSLGKREEICALSAPAVESSELQNTVDPLTQVIWFETTNCTDPQKRSPFVPIGFPTTSTVPMLAAPPSTTSVTVMDEDFEAAPAPIEPLTST